jgi:hypothetical protein
MLRETAVKKCVRLAGAPLQGWVAGFSAGFSKILGSTVGLNSNDVYSAVLDSCPFCLLWRTKGTVAHLFAGIIPIEAARTPRSGCGAGSAITPMANEARFRSMRPEKQSFTSAKSPEPIVIAAHS